MVIQLSQKSRRDIEPLDRRRLEEHLSYGVAAFERSPMGAMVDTIANQCWVSVTCLHCDHGILSDGKWCERCHGTGYHLRRIGRNEVFAAPTARPNLHVQRHQKQFPEGEQLTDYAAISRRLAALSEIQELMIRAAYGDWGERWQESTAGRAWACVPFTAAGAELIRTDPGSAGLRERPLQRLTELAQLDKSEPQLQRGKLLSDAVKQANRGLREAVACWNMLCELDETGRLSDVG